MTQQQQYTADMKEAIQRQKDRDSKKTSDLIANIEKVVNRRIIK
jgi:hypothetical protein